MKRRWVAVCLGSLLMACSGGNTQSRRNLGTGAGLDGGSDGGGSADAEAPGEDGSAQDGGQLDGSDALEAGPGAPDAGGPDAMVNDPNSFSLRVLYQGAAVPNAPVLFSLADGGVDKLVETNSEGVVTSSYPPAMVTVVLPTEQGSQLVTDNHMLSILAPALGDHVVVEVPDSMLPGEGSDVPYRVDVGAPPEGTYRVAGYAGVDGCLVNEWMDVYPQQAANYELRRARTCQLESNGMLLAVALGEAQADILGFVSVTLPAPGAATAPVVALGAFAPADTVTATLSNAPQWGEVEAFAQARKGLLRAPLPRDGQPTGNQQFGFRVPRSLLDNVETELWVKVDDDVHGFRKSRPASTTTVATDFATGLPLVTDLQGDFAEPLLPVLSWSLASPTPADAALVSFTYRWQPNPDELAYLTWRILVPGDRLTVTAPALPSMGDVGPVIPDGAEVDTRVSDIVFFDSDQQSGYRDFLKEPLRFTGEKAYQSRVGQQPAVLERQIPANANLRVLVHFTASVVGT